MDTISKKLTAIEKSISAIKGTMATKEDMKTMVTKEDLRTMATKEDLKRMATKEGLKSVRGDMKNLESRLKGDINNMATKEDMKRLEVRLTEKIEEAQMEIIATVDKHKADKETINVLEKRVDRLEDSANLINPIEPL